MHNISQKILGAEHLTEVIAFLKNADRFIRQGEIPSALEEILRAREKNPTIMYARAYEEYVRSVLLKQSEESADEGGRRAVIDQLMPTLERILDLAIKEVKRSAVTAYKQKEVFALQRRQEEDQRNEEHLRLRGITAKVSDYLHRARNREKVKDFHGALNEVARAFMLDPTDERIPQVEEAVKAAQERHGKEEESLNRVRQKEENFRRERLMEQWKKERILERERELRQRDEDHKQARAQKIREYLQTARALFADQRIEEAMSQLSFVMVLDPLNEEVLALNWKIREAQARKQEQSVEDRKRAAEEERRKAEAIKETVLKQLERAESLLLERRYPDALRVITQAYFIDPTSEAVLDCERRILAAEEADQRHSEEQRKQEDEERVRQQEAELHRLAIEQQKREQMRERIEMESRLVRDQEEILLFLSKARGYLSQSKFDEALTQVGLAFKINPFDDDITKLQKEILEAQRKAKLARKAPLLAVIEQAPQRDHAVAEAVAQHIEQAQSRRSRQEFREALDEIAQAYRHDPMNEELFALEGEIQQELLRYEEEQRRYKEAATKDQGIRKSLAMAREALSRDAFGQAMAWADYAMSFDMQRAETLQLRDDIERAQRRAEEQKANEDKELVIQFHLSKAMEFISEKRPFEAIFEVDLALRLNAHHKDALALRKRLSESSGEPVIS